MLALWGRIIIRCCVMLEQQLLNVPIASSDSDIQVVVSEVVDESVLASL